MNFQKLCVLGLGYIGLPTASTFATHGLQVVGVDVNPLVVETLSEGNLHIHEPGLRTLVQAALRSGNLVIRQEPEPADAFIIAVPTPFYDDPGNLQGDKRADMSYVRAATQSIVPHLRSGSLVILESTSPAAHHPGYRCPNPGTERFKSRAGFFPGIFARTRAARANPARAGR